MEIFLQHRLTSFRYLNILPALKRASLTAAASSHNFAASIWNAKQSSASHWAELPQAPVLVDL